MEIHTTKAEEKFSILFNENYFKIRKYAYNLLRSECDAEDVAQEVFIKLWEQQELWLTNERKLDGYLLIMTRNIALNILKHERIKQEYQTRFVQEAASRERMDNDKFWEVIFYREILQNVFTALKTVPKRRRSIFTLSRFSGKSHREIAYGLNISIHTVERQIYLTQIKLREVLFFI